VATSRIDDQVGRVLGGRYRLLAPIGTGASAHVYSADDVKLRRRVAVKVLHSALADDEAFLRRFRAEAQAVAGLRHPNILHVYDWGEDDGSPFLVLELLGGGSLRSLLDTGYRLTPSQALLVGLDAAKALDYAHRRGLVHRDIKPANLLFDEEGRLCIADFGIARALAEAAWTEPAGAVLGTARYASPEQVEGAAVDGRSDVYALALVLVEAVTGRVPFAADTTIATLMGRVGKAIPVPPEMGPLASAIELAGQAEPADRVDAAGLVQALDRAARSLPRPDPLPLTGTRPIDDTTVAVDLTVLPPRRVEAPALGEPLPGPVPEAEDSSAERDDAPPRRKRRWALLIVMAMVVALALGGGAYVLGQAATPSHPVVDLVRKVPAAARAALAPEKLKVRVAGHEFNEDIPLGEVVRQHPAAGQKLKEGRSVSVWLSNGPQPRTVPDLSGRTGDEAKDILGNLGLKAVLVPKYDETAAPGSVMDWDHKTDQLLPGSEVQVTVSNGPEPRTISDWRGKPFDDTLRQAFSDAGLKIKRVDVFDDTIPPGSVVSTSPAAGQTAKRDSTVTVNVSKGPDLVAVPDVTGMSVDQATAALQAAGLVQSNVYGPVKKRVFATDPSAGVKVKRGTGVSLYTR
jgi:serine/threonine-protein kinase